MLRFFSPLTIRPFQVRSIHLAGTSFSAHGVNLSNQLSVWNTGRQMLVDSTQRNIESLQESSQKLVLMMRYADVNETIDDVLKPRCRLTTLRPLMQELVTLLNDSTTAITKESELRRNETRRLLAKATTIFAAEMLPGDEICELDEQVSALTVAAKHGSIDDVNRCKHAVQEKVERYEDQPHVLHARETCIKFYYNFLLSLKESEAIPYPDLRDSLEKKQLYIDATATSLLLKCPKKWSSREACVLSIGQALAEIDIWNLPNPKVRRSHSDEQPGPMNLSEATPAQVACRDNQSYSASV